jgi:hypothetical protein
MAGDRDGTVFARVALRREIAFAISRSGII